MVVEQNNPLHKKTSNRNRVCKCLHRRYRKGVLFLDSKIRILLYLNALYFTLKWVEPAAVAIVGIWGLISFALFIPNPYRALLIWGVFALLALVAQVFNPQGRC